MKKFAPRKAIISLARVQVRCSVRCFLSCSFDAVFKRGYFGWCLGWLPALGGRLLSVCLSVSLFACACLRFSCSYCCCYWNCWWLWWWVGPAFRFPFAPNIYSLTQVCLTHSYKAIKICIYISLTPSLPCLTAAPSCRTAQVLAGLFWGEHDVSSGRGGGGNGSKAYSPGPVDDNVASHRPCVRPALDCLEDAFGGGVEESFYGLVVLGRDFSVCGEREGKKNKDGSDKQQHARQRDGGKEVVVKKDEAKTK